MSVLYYTPGFSSAHTNIQYSLTQASQAPPNSNNNSNTIKPGPFTMCYKVTTHTLRCDVRPCLSDGRNLIVDPYAAPNRCGCHREKQIKSWFRCAHHGCCMQTSKLYCCPDSLKCEVVEYHRYDQAIRRSHADRSEGDGECGKAIVAAWPPLPVLDEDLFPSPEHHAPSHKRAVPLESPEFRDAFKNMLVVGRLIVDNALTIDSLLASTSHAQASHSANHGACARVLNPWECDELQQVESLKRLLEPFLRVRMKLVELFRASRGLLGLLEDREVSGLDGEMWMIKWDKM